MDNIYNILDHIFPLVVFIGLLLSWKVATARWFLISYVVVVTTSLLTMHLTIQWNTHYYIFESLVNLAFFIPIFYRRSLALMLYQKTGTKFYLYVYQKQTLSTQECTIAIVVALSIIVNAITWLEVLAYKYYLIDNAFFKLYLRDNIILLIQVILCGCFLTYASTAKSKELNYENTEY
ncbi:hypothetical protein L1077_17350 [Pseudoalteromonas luteoviolacea]|uniref:hypothetical protein n=1 Tax=Pseudoalteromonas luteoviolacea TaxID=43657 RepID=UPI001F365037|nr:hypothetical protein [Pseudoalteromonas luteoviolacea]MCF6441205.1 hypothetical protein [Pseudoalteromonas luteoviolacea]